MTMVNQSFQFLDKQNEEELLKNAVHSQVTGEYLQACSEPCQHLFARITNSCDLAFNYFCKMLYLRCLAGC